MPRAPSPAVANTIRFVLDGTVRALADVDPNTTVLDYLREGERRTGTKEGCAEGDCGACTVALGELSGRGIRYRAVNACLMLVPVLDGKALVTVESLKAADGAAHPVQRAMVAAHASQCGFCTPGIVMSLFAFGKSGAAPTRAALDDALAGNLCRCTGYRSILDAAAAIDRAPDDFDESEKKTVRLLKSLRRAETFSYVSHGKRFLAPATLDDLARLVRRHPDASLLAGGTDAGLWVTKEHRDLETVIYTGRVRELATLRRARGRLEVGAAVTYSDMMTAVAHEYPAFGELIRRLGSAQIRNLGTIAGNLATASPIGDTLPALIALDATVVLRKGAAVREVPLDRFFLGYRRTALRRGEFIERLHIPRTTPARRFAAYKVSKRFDQDISTVCAAFSLRLDGDRVRGIRIAYGGMAATPMRAAACERALLGRAWNAATIEDATQALGADFRPISDMRGSGAYRMLVARNLVRRFWMETTGQGGDMNLAFYGRRA